MIETVRGLKFRVTAVCFRIFPVLALVVFFLLNGCARPGYKPLETLYYNYNSDGKDKQLIVFLRGIGGSHEDFAGKGLVDDVLSRNLPFAMAAPNTHFGYYHERTLLRRLESDVILPAIEDGYSSIWLVGVSMGGLGSMLYLHEQPQHIRGVVLLSPFLGYKEIVQEIMASGGLRTWEPGNYDPEKEWQKMLWDWIRSDVANGRTAPVYVGCGDKDRYRYGTDLLSTVLPVENSTIIDGSHDYPTFAALWSHFLDRKFFAQK